jgi:hypothetical protein
MLIEYKCPHCPEWHELNSWTNRDIGNFIKALRNWASMEVPPPFTRDEWVTILTVELQRRARLKL